VYLVRAGAMQQLTRDDTWANLEWPDDTAASAPMRNVLTKALGVREDVEVTVSHAGLQDADVVLVCSDGLTNMLSDGEIVEVLSARSRDLAAACAELVSRANAAGGRDNISAVLARYGA
jgi:protein phosphatase